MQYSIEAQFVIFVLALEVLQRALMLVFGLSIDITSRIISTLHSFVVVSCSVMYFHGDITPSSRTPCIFSAAYMIWDISSMILIKYEPLVPLIVHHTFAAICLYSVSRFQPRALKYCYLLLITEVTVPINAIKFYFESKGDLSSVRYRVTRWVMLITWILARLYLFTYYFSWTYEEWDTLTFDMVLMSGIGPFLFLFNVAGLFKMVLVGFPWTSTSMSNNTAKKVV